MKKRYILWADAEALSVRQFYRQFFIDNLPDNRRVALIEDEAIYLDFHAKLPIFPSG